MIFTSKKCFFFHKFLEKKDVFLKNKNSHTSFFITLLKIEWESLKTNVCKL